MSYVDGFVIAVPKAKLEEYKALSQRMGQLWKQHGALHYVECVADDVPYGERTSFPRAVQATEDETVVFSWIVYASRAERDRINDLVMKDPTIAAGMGSVPFDMKRMIYGGFETMLEL